MSLRTKKVILTNEARILRQMRIAKGLSMRAAGAAVGRSDSYISQIENGRMSIPGKSMLEKILEAYGGGIKVRSFYERARLLKNQRTTKEHLIEIVEKLNDQQADTVLAVAKSLLQ